MVEIGNIGFAKLMIFWHSNSTNLNPQCDLGFEYVLLHNLTYHLKPYIVLKDKWIKRIWISLVAMVWIFVIGVSNFELLEFRNK